MKKLLVVILTGLLYGISLTGCGSDSGFEAVIIMPADVIVLGQLAEGSRLFPVGGLLILVQKSESDPTPVPNVNISIFSGGIFGSTIMCQTPGISFPGGVLTCDVPAGTGTFWQTITDENGRVLVFPETTLALCLGATLDIKGSATVTAVISADQQSWTQTFTIDCI